MDATYVVPDARRIGITAARVIHLVFSTVRFENQRTCIKNNRISISVNQGFPMRHLVSALILMAVLGPACAGDLCKDNSFTKAQAVKGRWAYDSSCGLCHQYNLAGRVPGNSRNETPSIGVLDAHYLKTLDDNGGMTPPLSGDAFFKKWKDQKAFADRVSTAIDGFPPRNYIKPDSDAQIAAYILYEYCKKL